MEQLLGLFLASFAAATLVPLPSEAALYAYLQANPGRAALAVAVATLGNTAGGMTSYLLGRLFPARQVKHGILQFMQKHGAPALVLAWVPFAGDALVAAAGWLRINWLAALAFMAAGRLARYIVIAALS